MPEAATAESAAGGEHAITPLELFFDLVFVFAITQVTALLSHDPSWHGVIRGALALAAVWWAWTGYAWLTSTLNVDEGGVRLLVLAATAAMLGLALALPQALGELRPQGSQLLLGRLEEHPRRHGQPIRFLRFDL